MTKRTRGQTVLFGDFEWLYNPNGIHPSTSRQIEQLTAAGEGPIVVIQWPAGEVVFEIASSHCKTTVPDCARAHGEEA